MDIFWLYVNARVKQKDANYKIVTLLANFLIIKL